MPSQSISSVEAQIGSLTSDITDLNNQIATKQSSLTIQQGKLPALSAKYTITKKRLEYVIAKAKKAGPKQKDCQSYDNLYLFPASGGCYTRDHWNQQWSHYSGLANKAIDAYNAQKGIVDTIASQLSSLKGAVGDKVKERDLAVAAKNALLKAESDAGLAAATAEAITNPEIVKAGLAAEQAKKEAELANNRKLFIYAMSTIAFVVAVVLVIRAVK